MTITDITKLLEEWREVIQPLEDQVEALQKIFSCVGGPLVDQIHAIEIYATKTVAERIGCDADMLTDWWLTHNFGEKPMRVRVNDEPWRELTNNSEMAQFIAEPGMVQETPELQRIEKLESMLHEFLGLTYESTGVTGFYTNAIASWNEFDFVGEAEKLLKKKDAGN